MLVNSFIHNDIRFHWQILVRSPIGSEDDDVRGMQLIRRLWALRKLGAVVVEATRTLDGTRKGIGELADAGGPLEKSTRKSNYFAVATKLRNKNTFHFDTDIIADDLAHFKLDAEHRIFASKARGNTISELAEQASTLPIILGSGDGNHGSIEEFTDWCLNASSELAKFSERATGLIIATAFPDKISKIRALEVDDEMKNESHISPLFFEPFVKPTGNQ